MDTSIVGSATFPSAAVVANTAASSSYLSNYMSSHHVHHMLNIHNHRSLTNSPISNPGSPGLDMIQEELPHINMFPLAGQFKSEIPLICHPQISVTDVQGMIIIY